MADDNLSNAFTYLINGITAAGGLGTAAYGLVDSSKSLWGGMSNPGFHCIRHAVERLAPAANDDPAVFGPKQVIQTLKANWLNGMAKADQKAAAKALIRLMLTPDTADKMARAAGVSSPNLVAAVTKAHNNQALDPPDISVLGQFDVVVSASLDLGYERADQVYRNCAKAAAMCVAVALAVIGSWYVYGKQSVPIAFLVGLVATPLAPMAKDLSTSLQTAVKAVGAFKR